MQFPAALRASRTIPTANGPLSPRTEPAPYNSERWYVYTAQFINLVQDKIACYCHQNIDTGPIIALLPIFTLLGQLIGSIVVYTSLKHKDATTYRVCFASQWPFSAVPFVLAALLPESPAWLVRRGKLAKALKAQQRLDSVGIDSGSIIDEIRTSILVEEEERKTQTYMDCFKSIHKRRTLIVAFTSALPQLFGLQLLANTSYFIQIVGLGSSNCLIFLILGIGLGLIANVVSWWVLNGFGKRFLCIISLATAMVLWLAMGIMRCFTGIVTIC